ncbi:MAG: hypothetical protein Ta2E_08930 [Mycoplasmoidaceae bacterium]|nr:MAG: hypothetical protein Ta2E_08930 [Mycoplasmoidaceae bacterium]
MDEDRKFKKIFGEDRKFEEKFKAMFKEKFKEKFENLGLLENVAGNDEREEFSSKSPRDDKIYQEPRTNQDTIEGKIAEEDKRFGEKRTEKLEKIEHVGNDDECEDEIIEEEEDMLEEEINDKPDLA